MKLGLRAQICTQCQRCPGAPEPIQLLAPRACEGRCALFSQVPRLFRFFEYHHATPPCGYEEFAIKLLRDSSASASGSDPSSSNGSPESAPFLDYATEALALL
jgi:hypothetical protein